MKKYFKDLEGSIYFKYNLKNTNWFNIGGIIEAYFKPKNLEDLVKLIKKIKKKRKITYYRSRFKFINK